MQESIERAAAEVVEIEPFSDLMYELNVYELASQIVFCFLRKDGSQSSAPQWSSFSINSKVLDEVREKMLNEFFGGNVQSRVAIT